jgi:hypothetical protein
MAWPASRLIVRGICWPWYQNACAVPPVSATEPGDIGPKSHGRLVIVIVVGGGSGVAVTFGEPSAAIAIRLAPAT